MATWQATSTRITGTLVRQLAHCAAATVRRDSRSMWVLNQLLTLARLRKLWRPPCPAS